jgi:hypothetical protein
VGVAADLEGVEVADDVEVADVDAIDEEDLFGVDVAISNFYVAADGPAEDFPVD